MPVPVDDLPAVIDGYLAQAMRLTMRVFAAEIDRIGLDGTKSHHKPDANHVYVNPIVGRDDPALFRL